MVGPDGTPCGCPSCSGEDCDRGLVPMKCEKKDCDYKLPHYHCAICGNQVNSDELRRDYHPCCSEKCIKIYNKQYDGIGK